MIVEAENACAFSKYYVVYLIAHREHVDPSLLDDDDDDVFVFTHTLHPLSDN